MQAYVSDQSGNYSTSDHFRELTDGELSDALRAVNSLLIVLQKEQAHREYEQMEREMVKDD